MAPADEPSQGNPAGNTWLFTFDGKTRQGPCTFEELRRLAEAGKLERGHMIKPVDAGKWIRAEEAAGLWDASSDAGKIPEAFPPDVPPAAPSPPQVSPPEALPFVEEVWYYAKAGVRNGPVPISRMVELVAVGGLGPDDMVWKIGMAGWTNAGSIESLFPHGTMPPPLPPPLPPAVVLPVARPLEQYPTPSTSDRVTGEVNLVGRNGWGTSELNLTLDDELIAVSNWIEGFHRVPFATTVGTHSLRLRIKESDFQTAVYRLELSRSGHYRVDFTTGWFLQEFPKGLEQDLVGPALENMPVAPARRKLLQGLWKAVDGSGQTFMFTQDGAMVRDDGFAARFRWLNRETIELFAEDCAETVPYTILSLGKHELILKFGPESAHFERGQTITEAEAEKREKEARQRRAEAAQNFRNRAVGTASVLAAGGFAVLCGGLAIAAAGSASAGAAGGNSFTGKKTCWNCHHYFDARRPTCHNCGAVNR